MFSAEFTWMWRTLRRLGVAPSDIEDVAHDIFVQVYAKIDAYDRSRPVRPWLFAFAYRSASDYRRLGRHREMPTAELPEVSSEQPRADELLERNERAALVQAALEMVDFDRRAVLVAIEIDGTPMKDVAEALGIPLNTAYSRLRLARVEFTAAVRRVTLRRNHPVSQPTRGEA